MVSAIFSGISFDKSLINNVAIVILVEGRIINIFVSSDLLT